jgi:hypothetical protein
MNTNSLSYLSNLDQFRDRVLKLSIPEPNSGCWLWLGRCNPKGYGMMWHKRKSFLAHRVSYRVFVGAIPPADTVWGWAHILHKCDNPTCINPDHLFAGDAQDNTDDMYHKGRDHHANGLDHGMVKLTDAIAREIHLSSEPPSVLAARYGVHESHARKIRAGTRRQIAISQ